MDLFAGLNRVALSQLAAHLEPLALEDGEELFQEGDEGDALYIVAQGTVEVVLPSADGRGETRLTTLETGAYLGEMALITGERRSATVRSLGSSFVLRLGRDRFRELLGSEPSVAQSVMSVLSQRLRVADAGLRRISGRLFSHAQARVAAFAYTGVAIASLLLLTPYWRMLGLLS